MEKETISRVVENIINNYLVDHANLRNLFDENSKDSFSFFKGNFSDILITMEQLLFENKETQKDIRSIYSDCLGLIESDFNSAIEKRHYKNYQKRMVVAVMIHKLVSQDLTIEDLPFDYTDLKNNGGEYWYRGQSDYQWHLIPSMFRNLGNIFTKETKIDKMIIESIYSNNGMMDRWWQVFKSSRIDYNFLSYMQHSISYSPLLDFTSSFPTALSFSLCNRSSVNDFAYKDSSVFQIEITDDQRIKSDYKDLPDNFHINFLPDKYVIGTAILGKPMLTYDEIIKALTPQFVMIDTVSNDRMRYQNGKFIFFYNYLSLQGTICTWLNKDLQVTKYRISKNEKIRWCNKLRSDYPYLMVDKMMNPYSYFADQ